MFKLATLLKQRLGLLVCCGVLSACASAGGGSPAAAPLIERVIVQFKTPQADPAARVAKLAQDYQLGMVYERAMGGNFHVAALKPAKTQTELQPYLTQIAHDADVASIEADLLMQTMPAQ